MVHLNLVSVGMVQDTGSVILVLRAQDLARLLVMEIGLLEGRAIALEAEGIRAPRPLTHDLLHQVVERLGARVVEVQIRNYAEKTFFATIVLEQDEKSIEIDSRPSDAIALALRTGAPVTVSEDVLAEAGIDEEEGESVLDADEEDEEEDDEDEDEDEDEDDEEDDGEPVVH
ncbi:MAG TPA: bifunctional nuclease family protein [Symbiobacteriaceae bacterium]|jgi:hypothetical protein